VLIPKNCGEEAGLASAEVIVSADTVLRQLCLDSIEQLRFHDAPVLGRKGSSLVADLTNVDAVPGWAAIR